MMVNLNDIVLTPEAVAADAVAFFAPSGKCLDPCKGNGAFFKHMPEGSDWCEIREGRDFFGYRERADWIISNPPYSIFTEFMRHALSLADNIVWLMPLHKPFGSWPRLEALRAWGWIRHIRIYGPSRYCGLDMGFVSGAVHYERGYDGPTGWSFADVSLTKMRRTEKVRDLYVAPLFDGLPMLVEDSHA